MKKVLLTAAICLTSAVAFGQIKNVKAAYKAASLEKPDFAVAESEIKPALESADSKDLAETWWTAGYIQDRKFETEKIKLTLGQQANEAVMYPALIAAYDYWMKAVELDAKPNAKGKIAPKYTKRIKENLLPNHSYFINGGANAYDKQDYKTAYIYFDKYIQMAQNELFKDKELQKDSQYLVIKFYRAVTASQDENPELAVKCYEDMKNDGYKENEVYQYLCTELEKLKDTVKIEATLKEGITKFPQEPYYIQSLINLYIYSNRSDDAIVYLNEAIKNEPNSAQLWDVKGRLHEGKNEFDSAKEAFQKAIDIDPNNVDALIDMGRLFFNDAVRKNDEVSLIKDQKEYKEALEKLNDIYKQALPFFEKAHKIKPDSREAMVALRGIYYKLNMGAEYEAIEALMNK